MKDTRDVAYKERLQNYETWWKQLLDVQRPYRANLARLQPGFVLDIGCGIGRNLKNLAQAGIASIGVDHNEYSVTEARRRGLKAFTTEEFRDQYCNQHAVFDSLLVAHVLEHMTTSDAEQLLKEYLHLLKPGGQVIIITPQEKGFASDPTHVEFMTPAKLAEILHLLGVHVVKDYSFPFPRFVGNFFRHNEFVVVGQYSAD